jgi:hypothetical protein
MTILKWNLKEWALDSTDSVQEPVVEFCEHDNDPPHSIQGGKILDQNNDFPLLK